MLIVPPASITDGNLLDSNIVESLPLSSSGTSYTAWNAGTSYTIGNQVCVVGPNGYLGDRVGIPTFNLWTALYANTNLQPGWLRDPGDGSLPGYWTWTLNRQVQAYSATVSYSKGTLVGYINGATGAIYQSLTDGNIGNTPSGSPTNWRQTGTAYATYSAGTTYATGARTCVFYGTRGLLFESLQNSNTGNTPETSPLWWEYKGESFKDYDTTATYALGDTVISQDTHKEYESLQAANTNNALTDAAWWLETQTTNRWRMFDQVNSSQTTYGEIIDVTVTVSSVVDTIALMNISAATVQVIATDAVDGEVFNETYDLSSYTGITDWYAYFFDPITRPTDLLITGLPTYAGLTIQIIVNEPDGVAAVGTAVLGRGREIGDVVYGAQVGIQDYSRKVVDDFGNYSIVQRSFSRKSQLRVAVMAEKVDTIHKLLADYRAVPVVYIGTDLYTSTWAYGFYKDFSISIDYANYSYMNIELEGLT